MKLLVALLSALLLCSPARAQAGDVLHGFLCDTPEQVQEVISLTSSGEDPHAAIVKVNNGTNACAVTIVIYQRGPVKAHARSKGVLVDIVEITILAVFQVEKGTWALVRPHVQYTSFKAEGWEI